MMVMQPQGVNVTNEQIALCLGEANPSQPDKDLTSLAISGIPSREEELFISEPSPPPREADAGLGSAPLPIFPAT